MGISCPGNRGHRAPRFLQALGSRHGQVANHRRAGAGRFTCATGARPTARAPSRARHHRVREIVSTKRMSSGRLTDLQLRRAIECRLTPDRALMTLDDAQAFVSDRGLLTRMPDSALPSLFGACHEEPARAGGQGFALGPKTKWIWPFQLVHRPALLPPTLHHAKPLFLSP